MSAPIQLQGPYRSRRTARRARWLLIAMATALLTMPFIVTAVTAMVGR